MATKNQVTREMLTDKEWECVSNLFAFIRKIKQERRLTPAPDNGATA